MELLIYKLLSLATGTFCIWLGYCLFLAGVFRGDKSEMEALFGQNRVLIRRASPGLAFAAFGAMIVTIVVLKGYQGESTVAGPNASGVFVVSDDYLDSLTNQGIYQLKDRISESDKRVGERKNDTSTVPITGIVKHLSSGAETPATQLPRARKKSEGVAPGKTFGGNPIDAIELLEPPKP